jgi:superkiller protein 3
LSTQNLYGARLLTHFVLPSRCVRCGAASRDFLCPSCVDYLIAYQPLWLNPALLPGPSLLDLGAPREVPFVSADLKAVEWEPARSDALAEDAVRLVRLVGLDGGVHPALSVGDADLLHRFLRDARRSTPANPEEREALARLYRYLSSSDWIPSHLAAEYRLRADTVAPFGMETTEEPEGPAQAAADEMVPQPPLPESSPGVPKAEPLPDLSSMDLEPLEEEVPLPAPDPFHPEPAPEPIPQPEPPLPLPEPPSPQPEPEPEPEPEEAGGDDRNRTELEELRHALQEERVGMEAWTRGQVADLRTKEAVLEDRESSLGAKERERVDAETRARSKLEELQAKEAALEQRESVLGSKERDLTRQSHAVTDRLAAFEKDEARRAVLRILGQVPGMSEALADVLATAFPDLASLQAADAKALAQCQGVSETLALAIRHELVPGEVDDEQHAAQLREQAQGFLEEGDYKAALASYDRLLQDRPGEIGLWFDRADVLVLLDRKEDAIQCYRRVVELDRANPRAWFEQGNLLFGLGRLPDAIHVLREALRLDPSKAGDIVLKAEALRRDGHPTEAVNLYQAVLDGNPAEVRAVLGLGDALLALGDAEAAETHFTQALGKNPQNAMIAFRKGELLERKGRWGASIQYYNRAIALKWNFAGPWLAKAKILLEHDRATEALECYDKATSFEPGSAEAWAGKARAHWILGDREAAAATLARAEGLDPKNPSVIAARELAGALATREPAEPPEEPSEDKATASDLHALVKAFEEIEDEPEQVIPPASGADFSSFVESIEPEEEEVHVLIQLAELALEGGDAQMALLRYEQAIQQEEKSADAWVGKGVALQQLERYREALDAYDRALSIQPEHGLAQKWRATCLRHLAREASG